MNTSASAAGQTLAALYNRASKHSNYQVLARRVQALLGEQGLSVVSRHERERLAWIAQQVDFTDQQVVDIGGNTGFFSFEALDLGAAKVTYCEGNAEHCAFVRQAAEMLGEQSRLQVQPGYVDFNGHWPGRVGVMLLLNVLHHIGDDYGDSNLAQERALEHVANTLRALAGNVSTLVFQLGFNWKGDRHLPLFSEGTKAQMIGFIEQVVAGYWEIQAIGVAQSLPTGGVEYAALSAQNLPRADALGEFLNRPLFVLRSLR